MSDRAERRVRVLIVGPAPSGPLSRGGMATVTRLMLDTPDSRFAISSVATYVDGSLAQRLRVGVRGMIVASWCLLRGRADVLHVHLSHGGSVIRKSLPLLTARAIGVPAVIHGHSFDFAGWFEGLPAFAQRLVRAALPATRWLVLGEGLAQQYADCMKLPPAKVGVLYNAVRIPRSRVHQGDADPVRAVALGRLGTRKGSYDLIAALAILPREVRSRLQVTVAGDGEIEEVRTAAREAGVQDIVAVVGWIGPIERDDLLGRSHVFVLPSYDEGLPMALLEAMAHGLVPIATPVGSIGEAITDRVDGLLVTPGDRGALVDALSAVVLDDALRTRLAAAARDRASAFDLNRWYCELGSVWDGLARDSRRRRGRTTP
ncbi:glycosyltransferase involved in cell wall biosynthesis [Rhodococcus sp. PvR044]|uniref:glycosyltransferase family 4 protein n=1 Tax=unclassified Rhodococcus (in: high G+C Gram-positive bacteria) TaxID=192944 RepID=UPI000BD1BF9C|nr:MULTISPECIES: glycosyltransferase family 4 protein [unclassified Rhodococcus (in: high G+C Gram-positive bacteria)]PTR42822.1 glycosyltransferase involved in cell wall biosynthesis [Rhodococcus sp. OK611]SNX91821.1 Glycosyltransferase involved in cell wall bisynthesis [Rhodococcus sp. OK270]